MMRVALLAALALVAGCQEKKAAEGEPPPPMIEPMEEGELQVGKEACNAYVEQVCGCVAKKPELFEECQLAPARANAFEMNTRAAMAQGDANSKDRRSLVANARKIMRSCIEDASELVKKGCPMTSAPPAPAPGK